MRKSSTPTVTLFPFLAVLMCTMGTLTLLLLVTARKIRLDVTDSVVQAPSVVVKPEPAPLPRVIEVPLLPELHDDTRERAERLAAQQREQARILETAAALAKQAQQHWQAQLDQQERAVLELEQQRQALNAKLKQATSSAASEQKQLTELNQKLADAQQRRRMAQQQVVSQVDGKSELGFREHAILAEVERLRQELSQQRPEFQVVAFDSATGTTRRPILIECTADEIRFGAERISLTPDQVNGYSPDANPLLAGATALIEYWKAKDSKVDPLSPPPYVLLLVRPEGTVAYYVSRGLLQELQQPFGFELVSTFEEIRWPDADPGAVRVCREAVEKALAQPKLAPPQQRLGGLPGDELPQVAGPDGRFSLPEVERLRQAPAGGDRTLQPEWAPARQPGAAPINPLSQSGPHSAAGVAARSFAEEVERNRLQRAKENSSRGNAAAGAASDVARVEGRRNWMDDGGVRRKWGKASPSATIGIEKELTVHVWPERIEMASGNAILISTQIDKGDLQAAVGALLDAEAKSWGEPPQMFVWRPTLKVIVHPGGTPHQARLQELFDHWGLSCKVERGE